MTATRRWLFLGLIVVGSQFGSGCCYNRPVLFPRLTLCGTGACGPVFPRLAPVSAPIAATPVVSGPVYDAPVYSGGYGGPVYGGPIYGGPGYGDGTHCANCGPGGGGIPIASTPPFTPPSTGAPAPGQPFVVPMTMPGGAMTNGGIPFDSALAPTVKPPGAGGKADLASDSKKAILTAGK